MEARTIRPLVGLATVLAFSTTAFGQYVIQAGPRIIYPGAAVQPAVQWSSAADVRPSLPPDAQPAPSRIRQSRPGRQVHARSENFIVFASSPEWAQQVAEHAESERQRLAKHWLGRELPPWPEPCPIHVQDQPNLGAGGETRFQLMSMSNGQQTVGNWTMMVQGTRERILDSVLPHEITHTVFATHFSRMGKYVPRWADEGACTTVEHESEKKKHRYHLRRFLQSGRGLAFNRMFRLKDYPDDILPLYAQGHSAVQFLIDQSSPQEFIQFIEQGMQSEDWNSALQHHYAYQSIGEFQTLWNKWLHEGSPNNLAGYAPKLDRDSNVRLASNQTPVTQGPSPNSLAGKTRFAIGNTDPTPAMLAAHNQGGYYQQRLQDVQSGRVPAQPEEVPTPGRWQATPQTSAPASVADQRPTRPLPSELAVKQQPTIGSVSRPESVPLTFEPKTQLPSNSPAISAQPSAATTQLVENARNTEAYRNSARQQEPQSIQTQVLDWGQSQPIRGIETRGPAGMPIYR